MGSGVALADAEGGRARSWLILSVGIRELEHRTTFNPNDATDRVRRMLSVSETQTSDSSDWEPTGYRNLI